jgi:hypothetical protein
MKRYLLIMHHLMRTYWRSGDVAPYILNLGNIQSWNAQRHAPATLFAAKRAPGTHWIWDLVGHRIGLNAVANRKKYHNCSCRESNACHPARSLSKFISVYQSQQNILINKSSTVSVLTALNIEVMTGMEHKGGIIYFTKEYKYFPNVFFVVWRISLVMASIHCTYKSTVTNKPNVPNMITLQKTYCT